MELHRRRFLEILGWGAATPLALSACSADTEALRSPRGAPDAGAAALDSSAPSSRDAGWAPVDGGQLVERDATVVDASAADAAPRLDAGAVELVVAASFGVQLYDPSCSEHDHGLTVSARAYPPGTEVHYLGGSHDLVFSTEEIARLEAGEAIPFATVGMGPGHGHCGLAWRIGQAPAEIPDAVACQPKGTAECLRR